MRRVLGVLLLLLAGPLAAQNDGDGPGTDYFDAGSELSQVARERAARNIAALLEAAGGE